MKRCQLTSCPLHATSHYKEVPYSGSKEAKVIFVGESESPNRQGKTIPFSPSIDYGKLLRKGCSTVGIAWQDLFIMNAARCRIDTKKMTTKEINQTLANCRRHIKQVMTALKPKIIVAMGNFALQQIIKRKGITKNRGSWIWNKEFNCWVFCMFHPAYIIRNMALEPLLIEDLTQVKEAIKNKYSPEFEDISDWKEINTIKGVFTKEQLKDGIGYDTECQGLEWTNLDYVVIGYSISAEEGKGYFIRLYEETQREKDAVFSFDWMRAPKGTKKKELMRIHVKPAPGFLQKLKELRILLESKDIKKYMHNGNFDIHTTTALYRNAGQSVPTLRSYAMDTQAAAQLIEENIFIQCKLTQLQRTFTTIRGDYDGDFVKRWPKDDMLAVPAKELGFYAGGDADTTRRVALRLKTELLKYKKMAKYFVRFVMPTLQSLAKMEENGAYVDQKQLPIATEEIKQLMDKATKNCLKYVPKTIKDTHRKQGLRFTRDFFIRDVLFSEDGYHLKSVKLTKGKEPSVDQDVRRILLDRRLSQKCRTFLLYLNDFKRYNTLYTRYLKGFKKSIKHDGFIHTKYSLATTKTGRVACLTGDTRVTTLGSKGNVRIDQIKKDDWVWAFDTNLKPVPAQVSWSGKTIENAELWEVSYLTQGARKIKKIKGTGDHPFKLRDGSYIKLKNLQKGMRLMSLERSMAGKYRRVHTTGSKEFMEHVYINRYFEGINEEVHHKDKDKLNNIPFNLKGCTKKEHHTYHPMTRIRACKISNTMKKLYETGKKKTQQLFGYKNPNYYTLNKEWALMVLRENSGKPTAFRDIYGLDYTTVIRKLKQLNIDWRKIQDRFRKKDGSYITDKELVQAKKAITFTEAKTLLNVSYPKVKRLLATDNNHVVINVKKLSYKQDVFDITVKKYHNFIANGVCVHNSSDPNLMNIPKRGPDAPVVRRLICAPPGWLLLASDVAQSELRWAAMIADDPAMKQVFKENRDIHTATAIALSGKTLKAFNVLPEKEQAILRRNAKPVNFGLLYGMLAAGFVLYAKKEYNIDLSIPEAELWISIFFRKYDQLPVYHKKTIAFCRTHGYVESPIGRRRRLPEINSKDNMLRYSAERMAINLPIQSISSDAVLMADNKIEEQDHNPEKFKSSLFIHDELVYLVRDTSEVEDYGKILKNAMENPPFERDFGYTLTVPLQADVKVGKNLVEMEALDI